ncbi:MAG: helix-turn-helix domain-containing protein [Eubacteriales bacterium]|nr:helix-turn-helix domain-containing protein [Eubacteriales bacterium]
MNREEFRLTLLEAVSGSHEALEKILELYAPLIDKHSFVNGRMDEDLRQYILIHIALNISKFPM